jgi:hypothetical protein
MQLMPITHFNYSWGFFGRGSKGEKEKEGGKSSTAESRTQMKPEAIYRTRRMHFIADHNFHPRFLLFFTFHLSKIGFAKTRFDFVFSTCAREQRQQHRR